MGRRKSRTVPVRGCCELPTTEQNEDTDRDESNPCWYLRCCISLCSVSIKQHHMAGLIIALPLLLRAEAKRCACDVLYREGRVWIRYATWFRCPLVLSHRCCRMLQYAQQTTFISNKSISNNWHYVMILFFSCFCVRFVGNFTVGSFFDWHNEHSTPIISSFL